MSKPNKWAVETAVSEMRNAITAKLRKWDEAHPRKARTITEVELATIAVGDPAWQKQVVSHVRRGACDIDLNRYNLLEYSPKAAEVEKKNQALDAPRKKIRDAYEAALYEKLNRISRQASIGGMSNGDLLQAVNEFCEA